jgi:glycosyl transferase family 2
MTLALVLLSIAAIVWIGYTAAALAMFRRVPIVERLEAEPPPGRLPKLSIIVAARNEAAHLEAALESKLAQRYPELEVIVVDDRSTDGTGPILDAMAARDRRIVPIHVDHLPDGWLGKLNAMHRGIEAATGEWLLLSDADVYLEPTTLARVIAWAEREGVDHVSALPTVWSKSVLFDAIVASALRMITVVFRVWAVRDPGSSAAMGCGAFNLMRKSAYERTPGLEHLKMEVGDDVALGQMLKRSGARSAFVNGRRSMSLEFYPSLRDMAKNVEKGAGAGGVPLWLGCASILGFWMLEISPLLALVVPTSSWVAPAMAIGVSVWAMALAAAMNRWMGQPAWPAVLFPIGTTILAWMMLRSEVLAMIRGGIVWRDTFYPLETVRAGSRLRFRPYPRSMDSAVGRPIGRSTDEVSRV